MGIFVHILSSSTFIMSEMYLKEIDFRTASDEECRLYRESNRTNEECADAIRTAIAENYGVKSEYCLDVQGVLDSVLSEYEPEQVAYCLATAIDEMNHDGRFSQDNKEWAREIRENLPEQYTDRDKNYTVSHIVSALEQAHQVLVDSVAEDFREAYPDLKLEVPEQNRNKSEMERC